MAPSENRGSAYNLHLGVENYCALCLAEHSTELDFVSPELVAVAEALLDAAFELGVGEAALIKESARYWDVASVLRGGATDEYARIYFTSVRLLRARWRLRTSSGGPVQRSGTRAR